MAASVALVGNKLGWFEPELLKFDPPVAVSPVEDSGSVEKTGELSDSSTQDPSDDLGVIEEEVVVVKPTKRDSGESGGVDALAARAEYLASLPRRGKLEGVSKDANETVAVLHDELRGEKDIPALRSAIFAPEEFVLEDYLKAPKAWLTKTRPGRINQAKEPKPDVEPLRAIGARYHDILQGESVVFRVKLEPEMPVTFHAQLGQFGNQLKTISVAASKRGVAKVVYKAVSGVRGPIKIYAASPVHSGRLGYIVNVAVAETDNQ